MYDNQNQLFQNNIVCTFQICLQSQQVAGYLLFLVTMKKNTFNNTLGKANKRYPTSDFPS